jgi:hypothetical protein
MLAFSSIQSHFLGALLAPVSVTQAILGIAAVLGDIVNGLYGPALNRYWIDGRLL